MLKVLVFLVVLAIGLRLVTGRWPWAYAATGRTEEERARRLLGVSRQAGREEILAAHRRLVTQSHPDRGGDEEATRAANAARDTLLKRTPNNSGH
jgi:hypothetical protein